MGLSVLRSSEDHGSVIAQERLAAIGRIAAGIAHEIKNPLFAISSGIQLLLEELVLDDEQPPSRLKTR